METVKPLATCLATHVGRVRTNNEDALAEDRDLGLLVLADGMGGHQAGEVASDLAVRSIVEVVRNGAGAGANAPRSRALLERAMQVAHNRVRDAASAQAEHSGMGTTAIACLIGPTSLTLAHVGDSRAYRWRGGRLQQLTRDHSRVQELMDQHALSRQDALRRVGGNILTRALGVERELRVDLIEEPLQTDDLVLLCSDGLTDMLEDAAIARLLEDTKDLKAAGKALIDAALEAGGVDNVSIALARQLRVSDSRPRGWLSWIPGAVASKRRSR